MNAAEQFFYDHAGYSYDPATETEEDGRRRCAAELAAAEQWAKRLGLSVEWEDDWTIDHVREFDCYEIDPETCETALLQDLDGRVVGFLSCIDDADANYRRVIAAELAAEYQSEITQMWAKNLRGW